jgi:tetratricopeptide (TPR) repeat protein
MTANIVTPPPTPPTPPIPRKKTVEMPTLTNNERSLSERSHGSSTSHASSSHATPTTHASSTSPEPPQEGTARALDYSSHACDCLQDADLQGALTWYQRSLLVYQTEAAEAKDPPLGIVDTCNAAATLHNMGAVYNALQQGDAALQCYHDAEQLYRECRERLDTPTRLFLRELDDQETVCLTALIAETLHHRASIYETSVWDSVAALECHEACVQLLAKEKTILETTTTIHVTVVDDVYFQQECLLDVQLHWLTASYQALAKLYRQSDTPKDGFGPLKAWKTILERRVQQNCSNEVAYKRSLADCYQQLAGLYFTQEDMTAGIDALHSAIDMQLELANNSSPEEMASAISKALSHDLLQAMNSLGEAKEEGGHFEEALLCYEKILLLVSRYLGEDHWQVAEALVKIGRVMECQGNVAGGLDLYHAAHTIYQAAVKSNAPEAEVDDADEDQAFSTRAATESVVRIANVLMGQKRWQEAVDFLRELPQTKVSWLGDDATEESPPSTALVTTNPSSVHQAIVFRELGRAYMGMGALAKAKQCLLESARRLEGTDHEEDVFELLMHVEFCQKQERKAALPTAKNRLRSRSRSRSRARSRSRSARGVSISRSEFEERGRISKEAVAAVLSLHADGAASGESRNLGITMPNTPTSPKYSYIQPQG